MAEGEAPFSAALSTPSLLAASVASTSDASTQTASEKIIVNFKAVGSAPLLKQSKFKVSSAQPFASLADFLRRQLQYTSRDPLFLYVNSAFAPAMDESLSSLFSCFAVDSMLLVNYSTTAAYG